MRRKTMESLCRGGIHFYGHVSQFAAREKTVKTICPTLLRNSIVWGEAEERLMLAREHFGAQGLPVYLYNNPCFRMSPVKWLLGGGSDKHLAAIEAAEDIIPPNCLHSVKDKTMRSMTGNQMHMAMVGLVQMILLASTKPLPIEESSGQ